MSQTIILELSDYDAALLLNFQKEKQKRLMN